MLIRLTSHRTMDEIDARVRAACAAEGFGVLGSLDLRAKLREKGQPYDRACVVYEVCRPDIAREALTACPDVATMLPCRISVYEDAAGARHLATARPQDLMAAAGADGLDSAAALVETALRRILGATA